jgi:hypothetical protein
MSEEGLKGFDIPHLEVSCCLGYDGDFFSFVFVPVVIVVLASVGN